MRVALIQLNSQNDKTANLQAAEKFILAAINEVKPDLITLPEMFVHLGGDLEQKKRAAENLASKQKSEHPAYSLMQRLAREHQIYIHAGSLIEFFAGQYFNTTVVFDPHGMDIVRYRKINLFQTKIPNGMSYDETKFFSAGDDVATYQIGDTIVGCAICYDLRFPFVFEKLIKKHVKLIVIPSAFTKITGQAHWELLCRSRAIETQSFLIAPAQTGSYLENGEEKHSWGHSMIVDPWGNILVNAETNLGYFYADLDFSFLADVRARLPVVKRIKEVGT